MACKPSLRFHLPARQAAGAVLLTKGNPKKAIISFAFPIFLSQLFQQLYNTADAWIVGHFRGTEALAAIGSTGSLVYLLISFFVGASMGAGVVISRYFGAGDEDRVSRAVHTNVVVSLISGLILSVFGYYMAPYLLHWMGNDLQQSVNYLQLYFSGAIAMIMYNSLKGVLNAVGDSRRPLYYLIFSSLLNILLDWLFVGVMGYGVGAAAIATVISQGASALLCLRQLCKKGNVYTLHLSQLRIDSSLLREIFKYGIPTGVQNSVIGLANVLVQTNINSFGKNAMAACAAYSKIEGFAFLPIMSFSMALTTYIGQNLGAREYERARIGARFGILTSITLAELIGVTTFFGARLFIWAFDKNPDVIRIGVRQCHIESLFFLLLAFSHCIAGICRGAGKAVVPMVIMLAVWCVFRIIYITVAMRISHTIDLLFWAYPITWSISSLIYLIYYRKSDWIHGFESHAKRREKLEGAVP